MKNNKKIISIILTVMWFVLLWIFFYIGYIIEFGNLRWYDLPYFLTVMIAMVVYTLFAIDYIIDYISERNKK